MNTRRDRIEARVDLFCPRCARNGGGNRSAYLTEGRIQKLLDLVAQHGETEVSLKALATINGSI